MRLRKAGRNYLGLCPFEKIKTPQPTFVINEAKGVFHCFQCGKGGNAVNFLEMMKG
jgi:DNA primase